MNKKELFIRQGTNIIGWTIRLYILFMIVYLVYDISTHPEMYVAVSQRPVRPALNQDGYLLSNTSSPIAVTPEWMYSASTIEECKPMNNLYNFYDMFVKPLLFLIVLYSLVYLITSFMKNYKDETNKNEEEKNLPPK